MFVTDPNGHDEFDRLHGSTLKRRQAEYYDQAAAEEFEITRPHGSPELYRLLLEEKFRRSLVGLPFVRPGALVLAVCAGSGMDAEFLAREGFRVVAVDLSREAVRRMGERGRRFGFELHPVVADVDHLPFRDATFDLVYVHDGLHHLENPFTGLAEMARVGASVSLTEPARAAGTAVAVKLGISLDREPSGNRVYRFTGDELVICLQSHGFSPLAIQRYLMYYRHEPGRLFRALSMPPLLPPVRAAYRVVNSAFGRWGNKITVQAVRRRA